MKNIILSLAVLSLMVGCSNNSNIEESVVVDSNESAYEVNTDKIDREVEGKVFKRNATIEMKVKDALIIGNDIQNNVFDNQGFVLSNKFNTDIIDSESINISSDSVKKMDKIAKRNELVVKVPVINLKKHIDYALDKGIIINSISIDNEELTFEKYKNDLNLTENTKAKESEKIENKIQKQIIKDDEKFATISYRLSQNPILISYTAARTDMEIYRDINLGLELKRAMKDGWYYMKMFIIYVVELLPTIILLIALFFGIKYIIKFFKKKELKG